jgi:hypothetical protein
MDKLIWSMLLVLISGYATAGSADLISAAPEGAAVYFIEPTDGATVTSPLTVKFGLTGMGVAPAGIDKENTGHHHLLIDNPEVSDTTPLPTTEQIVHFGGGQTETVVSLPPGEHQLQLVLGNYLHIPHSPPVKSQVITITVQ